MREKTRNIEEERVELEKEENNERMNGTPCVHVTEHQMGRTLSTLPLTEYEREFDGSERVL